MGIPCARTLAEKKREISWLNRPTRYPRRRQAGATRCSSASITTTPWTERGAPGSRNDVVLWRSFCRKHLGIPAENIRGSPARRSIRQGLRRRHRPPEASATPGGIRDGYAWLLAKMDGGKNPGLLTYSGHGMVVDGRPALSTASLGASGAGAILLRDLREAVSKAKAEQALTAIFDCCHVVAPAAQSHRGTGSGRRGRPVRTQRHRALAARPQGHRPGRLTLPRSSRRRSSGRPPMRRGRRGSTWITRAVKGELGAAKVPPAGALRPASRGGRRLPFFGTRRGRRPTDACGSAAAPAGLVHYHLPWLRRHGHGPGADRHDGRHAQQRHGLAGREFAHPHDVGWQQRSGMSTPPRSARSCPRPRRSSSPRSRCASTVAATCS